LASYLKDAERWSFDFTISGRPARTAGYPPSSHFSAVSPDYFQVMQIPLLKGRELTVRDGETAPWVVVINEAMARKFFPDKIQWAR
jgi:putative ABC transport system permease protein